MWLLTKLAPDPKRYAVNRETSMTMLNQLYQSPPVHEYLDAQEAYLRDEIVAAALDGKAFRREFVAGRLHEVQGFREKLRGAHGHMSNKRDALERESKKESSRAQAQSVSSDVKAV